MDAPVSHFRAPMFFFVFRDADIEVQTDGFDDMAYGRLGSVNDRTMGWGGGGLYITTFT